MPKGIWVGFMIRDDQLWEKYSPAKPPEPGPLRVVPLTVRCSICGATLEYSARLLEYRGYVACACGNQEPVGHSVPWNPPKPIRPCPGYERQRAHSIKVDQDEVDAKHELALRAPDPRRYNDSQEPRMRMLAEEDPSLAELGTEIEAFIDPEAKRRNEWRC